MSGGKTTACGGCHGADLKGLGRSPSCLGTPDVRYIQQRFRKGAGPNWLIVANLTTEQVLNIVAYEASGTP